LGYICIVGVPCEGVIVNDIEDRGVDDLWGVVQEVPCGGVIVRTTTGMHILIKGPPSFSGPDQQFLLPPLGGV
jgi:hypothetical protein